MIAIQGRDDGGLSWILQLVAVFVFFVLPVVRSIAESRKRAAQGQRPPAPARPRGERDGRDLWREMLEGRAEAAPRPPARPVAKPAAPPRAPPPPLPVAAPKPAPLPAPLPAPVAPALAPLADAPPVDPRLTTAVPSLASPSLDPATLDDELAQRWEGGAAPAASATRQAAAALLGGLDWRRALLVSELLAPPLALRGTTAAGLGPPASLGASRPWPTG